MDRKQVPGHQVLFWYGRLSKSLYLQGSLAGPKGFMAFDRLCDISQVEINGKNVGIVWCSPWEIEITDYIKPGKNELRLSVTNSLNNRMVYDAGLPEKMRITKSVPMIRSSKDKLLPSGIIENVEIRYR